MADGKSIYLNGKKLPFSREQFLELLKFIRSAIPKTFEEKEVEDDLKMLEGLENQLGKI